MIIFFSTLSYSQNCDNFFIGQYVPIEQVKDDSIYYLFTLSNCYELHSNKGYRNIYNIKWFKQCSFDMELSRTSSKAESSFKAGMKLHCLTKYINDSTYEIVINDKATKIKEFQGKDFWNLMTERDNELNKQKVEQDNILGKTNALMQAGDSLSAALYLFGNMTNSLSEATYLSTYEEIAINKFCTILKTFDAKEFYSNSSKEFQKQIKEKSLFQYFDSLKTTLGEWEYLSQLNESANGSMSNLEWTESDLTKYNFLVKFKNMDKEIIVSLSISNENDITEPIKGEENATSTTEGVKTFQCLDLCFSEIDSSKSLGIIAKPFFDDFYNKRYSNIYSNCTEGLQKNASSEQLEKYLTLANSTRNDKEFSLVKYELSINPRYGELITLTYSIEANSKNILLKLKYLEKNGVYKIEGISFK